MADVSWISQAAACALAAARGLPRRAVVGAAGRGEITRRKVGGRYYLDRDEFMGWLDAPGVPAGEPEELEWELR